MDIMKDYLNDFKLKNEENKLSNSAYNNLIKTYMNITPKNKDINENQKISIIIPTHNRFEQLTQLINSIFNQTYQNFEIILIDDISSDKTNEIYSNYPDKRLKYFLNYENLGMGLNRQKGYNLSTGDYVIFCDDDCYFIDEDYFFDLINIFKDENINIICSESYTHYEKENKYVYSSVNFNDGQIDSIEYLKNFMIKYRKPTSLFPAVFRRKTLIESQFKEMTMMNDTSVYLRALMMGGKTFINKKIIGIYRVHGENDTFNHESDFIIKNLEEKKKIYYYLKENHTIPNVEDWYAKQISITVNHYLKNTDDEKGMDNVLNWVWRNVSYEEYLKYLKKIKESFNVKLYYYKYPNVGDMLNEEILSSIFKLNFELDSFQSADLCAIGSILDMLFTNTNINNQNKKMQEDCDGNKPIHIWGTGLMHHYENINQSNVRPLIIHALRGEKTRQHLSKILEKDVSCVLADPGLLSPLIVKSSEKKWHMGIIPHYVDKEEEIFKKMLEYYPNSKIIDVQNETKDVLNEISMCEYIISTSLHGIIIADSYGIPNCWCEVSDKILGKRFKFHDYFSSFGNDREFFDLRSGNYPQIDKDFKCNFKSINQVHEKQEQLIDCFPLK
ncbi:glycosyltransferase [Methanobrevibacter millerae]|uniref:Glycosyltransferases involved in cell wall biogenesis n=1 Tax=Methanobrevibacter millerae TaxID=230361 RepID=A0A1G5V9Q7_9EURY|nr:glycosyltransferase [Methanobrevibacter millerae]SDA42368.1 Glycosyltransferases involved in cell wall biogenesis [Methanobrevibacter millerae]